jgi:TRAP-type C4-dicarboxylate transport system permease small subunit
MGERGRILARVVEWLLCAAVVAALAWGSWEAAKVPF